jgi:N-hydroxyarylamine O-acetyltransferase
VDVAGAQAYLERIGREDPLDPLEPDAETLADLQERHLHTVPFENLSIHLGEPVVLEENALFDKIVNRRRGGFCYEVNGLFSMLLRTLGYQVTLHAARAATPDGFGPPFDHLALRVATPTSPWPWLVDVGFGSFSERPLRLDSRGDQRDPAGVFQIVDEDDGDVVILKNGLPEYRLERRARELADFEPTCWWHTTSPKSHFTRSLVCSRLTDTGRVTLSGRMLIETVNGEKTERALGPDDGVVLDAYREYFRVNLEKVPALSS